MLPFSPGRDCRESHALAPFSHLESDMVEDRGQFFGKMAVDGCEQGGCVCRGFVSPKRPVKGTVAGVRHFAAQALEDRQLVLEGFQSPHAVGKFSAGERFIDQFFTTMRQSLGIEVITLETTAFDNENKSLGKSLFFGGLQVAQEWR